MVTSDFRPEVEIQPFRAWAMHPAIIGTVRSLWTWLWGRYHVPQNVFLVVFIIYVNARIYMSEQASCVWSPFSISQLKKCSESIDKMLLMLLWFAMF